MFSAYYSRMHQNGQVFALTTHAADGERLWAYRYRQAGRDSKRVQRGGFRSQAAARKALDAALDRLRRASGTSRTLTLRQLVDEHQAEPETTDKLRWLLAKSVAAFGEQPIDELSGRDIATWRMTLPAGHRFEATQALRQVFARAVAWEFIAINPAKTGVDNPVPVRREQRPFESWQQLRLLATALGPRYGPMILFAAATGLRPGEWIARAPRHRPRRGCRPRAASLSQRAHQNTQDTQQHPRRPPAGRCAASPRHPGPTRRVRPGVPRTSRRLPRPAQFPPAPLAPRSAAGRGRPDPTHLRPAPHLRDVRAARGPEYL